MKKIKVLLLFLVCSYSFGQVGPMLSEGNIPKELWNSIDNYDKDKRDMLGIVDILKNGQIIYGNSAHKMIERIGKKLLEGNTRSSEVKFFILRSNIYNAFATDQGYIFATTALLAQSNSEDEIAFVLAHELSHFLLKHATQTQAIIPSRIKEYQIRRRKADRLNESEKIVKKLQIEFDELIKSIYQFRQEQELAADSLGAVLYHKAGYSKIELSIAISNLQHDYPIFHKNKFNYKCLTDNISVPSFNKILDDSCENYKDFKTLVDKYKYAIIFDEEKKEMDYTFSTHPSWVKRLNQIKKLSAKLDFSSANVNLLPLNMEMNLDLLEELFTFNFVTGKYFLAMAYANILYQKDTSNSDYIVLNRIAQTAINIQFICKEHPPKLLVQKFGKPNLLNQIQELFFTMEKNQNIHWSFSQIILQDKKPSVWIEQLRKSYQHEISQYAVNFISRDSFEIVWCKTQTKFKFPNELFVDSSEILKNKKRGSFDKAIEEEVDSENESDYEASSRNYFRRSYDAPGFFKNQSGILNMNNKSTISDTIFQLIPTIIYLDRPKNLSKIKEMQYAEFYASEIETVAKRNNLVIMGIHGKDSFTTAEYNNDYLSWLQIQDRLNYKYNYMPYSGVSDQILTTKYKYLLRTSIIVENQQKAYVGDRILTYFASSVGIVFGVDFGSVLINGPRNTYVIQEIIGLDLKNNKAKFVYDYGLRVNKASLSVFVQNSLNDVQLILKSF